MPRIGAPSPALVVALLALFVGLGGTGYALITSGVPDAQGVFHGCVNKRSGALRVTAKPGACRKRRKRFPSELEVAWNQHGQAGANGANGANGTSVVARINGTAPLTTTTSTQPIALTTPTWNQAAGDINDFEATISYHAPASNNCSSKNNPVYEPGQLKVAIKVDGNDFGTAVAVADSNGAVDKTDRLGSRLPLWEPGGSGAAHTVTLEALDTCNFSAGNAVLQHFTITGVKIAVLGYR